MLRFLKELILPSIRVMHGPIPTVAVYRNGERIVVHALKQTPDAITYSAEPLRVLQEPVSPKDLGAAIRAVIKTNPHESMREADWKAADVLLAHALGLSSWTEAMKGTTMMEVLRLREELTFMPTDNHQSDSSDAGWIFQKDLARRSTTASSDEELGRIALETLALSV